ncbi:hydralysin-2 [Lysinibacillus sp. NPDC097162]|uniref:hydralysin-2 n=1 Tax=unclassified Lysinibacillus TaxID=2636778 RepID=UPI0037FE664E
MQTQLIREKFLFSDLPAMNSSYDKVREAFKEKFKVNPDGIAVNSETYFKGVTPAITEQYGHPCYKTLGDFTYTKGDGAPPKSVIVGSNIAVNHGDEAATMTLEVQGSWQSQQTWSTESTTGLTFSSKFTIEGFFESGMEFSVSTTIGESKTETESKTATAKIEVTVPPRSKKKVVIVGTLKKETMHFRAPIFVNGMFGANFPKRVQDHYFWFLNATSVLKNTSGEISGTIKNSAVFDVHTEIGKTEPLTAEELSEFMALTK